MNSITGLNPKKEFIVGEDMIFPVTKKHCDDECCTVGSICNISGNDLSEIPTDKLLVPRIEVIADYPNSKFEVGDILYKYTFDSLTTGTYIYTTNHDSPLQGCSLKKEYAESMPHLFLRLDWMQKRNIEDLPKYISHGNGKIRKVEKWIILEGGYELKILLNGNAQYVFHWSLNKLLPSTEQEFKTK